MSIVDPADALRQIAWIVREAAAENGDNPAGGIAEPSTPDTFGCTIKRLPKRLQEHAAAVSTRVNPANAPLQEFRTADTPAPDSPQALTVLTAKYWGPTPRRFTVSFLDAPPADLRARIVSHMNAWSATASVSFVETAGVGDVRISRGGGGYWSYLGTDITLVPKNRQTMNLQGFTMQTAESEFHRVVRHETGHTLGFPHEHMRRELVQRIDPEKAYKYFAATQGWTKQQVDQQVLTPLGEASIFGTPADQDSIMCYQLPGSITRDGQPIRGGTDIDATDAAFAALLYPKLPFPQQDPAVVDDELDWDPADDVVAAH